MTPLEDCHPMVRRDEAGHLAAVGGGNPASCWGDPAGESPVSVSGDAPSSRARTRTERAVGQAGRRKPVRQRELCSGEQARGQGSPRNTREPSAQPRSRQGGSYKPKAKSNTAQRQSEETIVLRMVATKNATGGKDLWGQCRIVREGTCKGMVAARPNFPGGRSSDDDVRRLPRRLRGAANQRPDHELHALLDQASRDDVLGGAQEIASGGCVMPHRVHPRPPVSRVREIRTHGLKGVLAQTHHQVGES